MKRKRLDRDIWTSIKSKNYIQKEIVSENFCGIISLLYLNKVKPVSKWNAALYGEIIVCGTGMKWLQFLPENEHYLMTAMISVKNEIVAIYVDVIDSYGKCEDGVFYYDDLYLDFILYPDGRIVIDDRKELEEVYKNNIITEEQYNLALQIQDKLLNGILKDFSYLNKFCFDYLSHIESIADHYK